MTQAKDIKWSCNPTFLTTKILETNRNATNTVAITKKMIETTRTSAL